MKPFIPNSYHELLQAVDAYQDFPKPSSQELLQNMGFREASGNARAPVFYAGDYTQGKYLYLDPACKNVLGYDQESLIAKGPMYFISLWHPADFKVYSEKIFPATVAFLRTKPENERLQYSSSINYRVLASNGKYLTFLQRATYYLHPENNTPLACIGFIIDITHYKDDTRIIHTMERIDANFASVAGEPEYKAIHYPEREDGLFTEREMEVLQLIHEGLSSKVIADRLTLSVNTVNNHRKNMLQKTGCGNVTELLRHAKDRHYL